VGIASITHSWEARGRREEKGTDALPQGSATSAAPWMLTRSRSSARDRSRIPRNPETPGRSVNGLHDMTDRDQRSRVICDRELSAEIFV